MSTPSGAGTVLTQLTLLVFRINGLLLDAGNRMTAPVGQTSARWQVLGVVDHGPVTVAAVARTMGLTRQSVQRTADRLAEDGLVAYVDHPRDRRTQRVTLTEKGRKVLRAIQSAQVAWARELGKAVGRKTMLRTIGGLEKLKDHLENAPPAERRARGGSATSAPAPRASGTRGAPRGSRPR